MKKLLLLCFAFSSLLVSAATTFYVAPSGGSDDPANTGTDKSAPFATITNALAKAQDGDTVMLLKGPHKLTSSLDVASAIVMCGEGENDEVVIDGQNAGHLLNVNTAGALLHSFSVIQMSENNAGKLGVSLTANSTVSNLVIRNNGNHWPKCGARYPLYATAGLVTHCWITNNVSLRTSGVYLAGSVVMENCYIAWNTTSSANKYWPGVIHVESANATVRNCTVVNNKSHTYGTLCLEKDAKVQNNIIYDNVDYATGEENNWSLISIASVSKCYGNCASPLLGTQDDGNIAENPMLEDDKMHFYKASPCYQAAVVDSENGVLAAEYDMNGIPRGEKPSIGAFEYVDSGEIACVVLVDKPYAIEPDAVELSVVVVDGSYSEPLSYEWDFDGDGDVDSTESSPCLGELGVYDVSVKISDGSGKTAVNSYSDPIVVYSGSGDVFVTSKSNPGAKPPYCTWQTASTNIAEALAYALDGKKLYLDDGEHTVYGLIDVFKGVEITGMSGFENTFIKRKSGTYQFFKLQHSAAVLSGVTIADGSFSTENGGIVAISAGTMRDCRISNNIASAGSWGFVYGNGANCVIERCVFSGNYGGAALHMQSGTVKDCLFSCNTNITKGQYYNGGALRCSGSGVKVYNSTFASNVVSAVNLPAGIYNKGKGTVRNCISYGNIAYDTDSTLYVDANDVGIAQGTAATKLSHSLMYPFAGDTGGYTGLIAADPLFKNTANGDYRLSVNSPCINTGTNLTFTANDIDLAGNARVRGKTIDIGCYEDQSLGGFRLIVR